MALGIIAEVRGGGVLEFAQVAEWEGGATDLEDMEPRQGSRKCYGTG